MRLWRISREMARNHELRLLIEMSEKAWRNLPPFHDPYRHSWEALKWLKETCAKYSIDLVRTVRAKTHLPEGRY